MGPNMRCFLGIYLKATCSRQVSVMIAIYGARLNLDLSNISTVPITQTQCSVEKLWRHTCG